VFDVNHDAGEDLMLGVTEIDVLGVVFILYESMLVLDVIDSRTGLVSCWKLMCIFSLAWRDE